MARYKHYDLNQSKMIPLSYADQIVEGSFEYALNEIVEEHLELSVFEHRYHNDETGRSAYDPRVLLKVVLYGYYRGVISSRRHRDRDVQEGKSAGPANEPEKAQRYRRKVAEIKAFLEQNEKKCGPTGNEQKSNLTDPESAKMTSSRGVIQGYDGLCVVDDRAVHAEAHGSGYEAHLFAKWRKAGLALVSRVSFSTASLARRTSADVRSLYLSLQDDVAGGPNTQARSERSVPQVFRMASAPALAYAGSHARHELVQRCRDARQLPWRASYGARTAWGPSGQSSKRPIWRCQNGPRGQGSDPSQESSSESWPKGNGAYHGILPNLLRPTRVLLRRPRLYRSNVAEGAKAVQHRVRSRV